MPKIPFRFLPAAWGLKGQARARAEAEYYLDGLDLEFRLAEIEHDDAFDCAEAKLGIKLKRKKITEQEHAYALIDLKLQHDKCSQQEHDLVKLDLDLRAEKISQSEYEKRTASIKREPWVNVIKIGIDPEAPAAGYFELDWNDEFVEFLQQSGYDGRSDEEVVNKWFNTVCATVLTQAQADQDYGFQSTDET